VKDELREGDQVMVKVLAIEGNRIKLSRKALIREQKAKLAQPTPAAEETFETEAQAGPPVVAPAAPTRPRHEYDEKQPRSNQSTILIEGGDFDEDEETVEIEEGDEPNFNRADGVPVTAGAPAGAGRPPVAANNRRRRRRRPGGGGPRPGGGGHHA
jgi:polyribonucleotide nucleotidyltransferase